MELEGKIFIVQPEQSGTGKNDKIWKKQGFIIETEEQYPKKVLFTAWNEMLDMLSFLKVGNKVKVSFRCESRSFNDKWYTDLTAWKIVKIEGTAVASGLETVSETEPEKSDDLPF